MQDNPNEPQHRDLIRGKRLAKGLSPEDNGLGHICATKDTRLLHKGADSGGR